MIPHWITVERTAAHTDLTRQQIYRLVREGKLPWRFVRLGKLIRISAVDLGLLEEPAPQNTEAPAQNEKFAAAV